MTTALAGHASRNSTDCFTESGTASLEMTSKPSRGNQASAVVVSRNTWATRARPADASTESTRVRPSPSPRREG